MDETFEVHMRRLDGFRFEIEFGADSLLRTDEPAPLGQGAGPTPARLVAAAAANCLAASLTLCLQKMKIPLDRLEATARGTLVRNERGRLRIGRIDVRLDVHTPVDSAELSRCLSIFRDYCVVTESLIHGFPVEVEVAVSGAVPS